MKLLIVGSRSIADYDLSPYVSPEVDTIISGGARGVDALAEQYADRLGLSKIILRPRYSLYRRAAPLKRNEQMVLMADTILIVWDGHSAGTKHTLKYAQKQNKPITLVTV